MSEKVRRGPSPALVISIVALVLAMSGTAVAASKLVSGDSLIKQNSLSGDRLKNGTVTGKQINVKTLGTVPNAAKAVSANTATTATTAGSAPISTVTYVTASSSVPYNVVSGTPDLVTAACPTGTTVIGGGASLSNEDYGIVSDSFPNGETGWSADFFNTGSGITVDGTVTAICAPAAATTT